MLVLNNDRVTWSAHYRKLMLVGADLVLPIPMGWASRWSRSRAAQMQISGSVNRTDCVECTPIGRDAALR
jgi:hypothetical protein